MKYILDYDRTLFDTDAFVAQVEQDGRSEVLFTSGIWEHYNARSFLYPDVLDWLGQKSKSDIHILTAVTPSKGDEADTFQRGKIQSGKFNELVGSVTFMVGEKGEAATSIASQWPPHEPIIFVDDKIEQCLSVQAALPQAICCLIVRDKSVIGDVREVQGLWVVHTLADVDVIIEKI